MPSRTVAEEITLPAHRHVLRPGVEFTATVLNGKRRQRMAFRQYVRTDAGGEWVDAWDGRLVRSIHLEAITVVHRTRKMAANHH